MNRDEAYKRAQEAWVSNCTGGSVAEIISVCSSLVASQALWVNLANANLVNPNDFASQLFIYVVPMVLSQTVAADYANVVSVSLLSLAMLVRMSCNQRAQQTSMDVGVGSVVFSSGIVSSRAYLSTIPSKSKLSQLVASVRSALSILILGTLRLLLTKGVDYQEHHSEYGLHWNFFFTLGFLPPFVTLASFLHRIVPFSILGLTTGAVYQFLLMQQGLQTWILEAPRIDLLSANKEGICSFAGYLSTFFLGLDSGMVVFDKYLSSHAISRWLGLQTASNRRQVIIHLSLRAAFYWILFFAWITFASNEESLSVSRRMANLPYILWVVAFNLSLLTALVLVEEAFGPGGAGRGPFLLEAVNINGLLTFLWANILTGLVNLSMKTLYASTLVSVAVCLAYMTAVSALPWTLNAYVYDMIAWDHVKWICNISQIGLPPDLDF
ncbi:hypothetical protein VTP01DRAFT_2625 [Rhizomucor pusillus]|uniref:uncharacterized protein n=1 Tax=Rhizomucor pusillus TaxID=4840 RepID=UPI0037424B49